MYPLRWMPRLTLLAMLGPVVAGLLGALAPAFGWMPAIGAQRLGFQAFESVLNWPGFATATRLSLTTGLLSTGISLGIVALIVAGWNGTRAFEALRRLLSPLLSIPHAAAAFGLAFLIMPSGWILRLLSPWATGFERPPDWLVVQDPWGLALVAGLVVKEVPFLLLMTLAALPQTQESKARAVSAALGYSKIRGWLITVFPQIYDQIRLPVYVVLAYAMTVVDVALILGPTTPSTLSVQILKWIGQPDLSFRLWAAAGGIIQLLLVIGALGVWRLGEIALGRWARRQVVQGHRGRFDKTLQVAGLTLGAFIAGAVLFGLLSLALWSVAGLWRFPDLLPDALTWRTWQRHGGNLTELFARTSFIAGTSAALALALSLACLEAEARFGMKNATRTLWLLYVPLLVPQTVFLPGLQTGMIAAGVVGGTGAVILAHLVFVLPYVFLSLSDPFRALDPRYAVIAQALGKGENAVFWRLRVPLLLTPILTAFAVGFAVSVGQYLATLLPGAGRVSTLTTEALALASGGDRRAIGAFGLMQTFAPIVPFVFAVFVPRLIYRNRRGLLNG
ncbi:MAG: ABC transporter permease subunit [Pseudomonadota bacterium]